MKQPVYTLHMTPDSAATILRLALRLTGARFAELPIDREGGELDSAAYRDLQPLGKIPAMQTPDGPMFETAAMLLYLADRHPGLAPAPDSPQRAAFLKWFFFTSTNLHPTILQMFYPERVAGEAHSVIVKTHAVQRLREYLTLLNAMVARDAPDWLSAKPSVFSYYIAVLIRWLAGFGPGTPGYIRSEEYPALHAVLLGLETTPVALAVAEIESLGPTIFTNPTY